MGQNDQSVVALEQHSQTQHVSVDGVGLSDNCQPVQDNVTDKTNVFDQAEEEKPICRICHCSSEDIEPGNQTESCNKIKSDSVSNDHSKLDINNPFFLISPCFCTGSLKYVHHNCLQHWIRSSNHKYCELCKYNFKLKTKSKPIYKWESLNMSRSERRKLLFQLTFNLISIIFVFWSIYVIAERATHELVGQLGWRFWLKMLIVTIGFICGILFIFFQLKLYISTIVRWKQFNQIIIIENVNSPHPISMRVGNVISTSIDLTCCESK